ncbi:hypothetical protein OLMES_3072 [Oleiphilus messinensis]|uniref:Lipoprotein n=1 Tax=Oleiphilus messinensis TaxID=141451 RepID=A0A1Y0ICC4_9GAMM|nr:hypothetical protein [Oleiphilus messinensis]ARU57115.1 hypothetical protein OLMES_3072 [Oleiphilus messinensis]
MKYWKYGGALACAMLSGCASYHAHYASFDARNSAGEERKFVVEWQSAKYPGWIWFDNETTPVKITTQCSEYELTFRDPGHSECSTEANAIAACGRVGKDISRDGREVSSPTQVCGTVTDANGATHISELGREIMITVSCWPESTTYQDGDEKKNIDYLKHSIVPYTIKTIEAPLFDMNRKPPQLSDNICEK